MAFEPNKIKAEHIWQAIDKVLRQKLDLQPSLSYDLVIENSKYPPKAIFKLAYLQATGKELENIYGGENVNKYFRKLGFSIEEKIEIWKLGCNWGKNSPSFYDFIKKQNIVLTVEQFKYKTGDLVLITEGFTVYAIAKILSEPIPVTENETYEDDFQKYLIDFDDNVLYANAEWYELPEKEVLYYQLQSGIRRVRKQTIREKAIDLFENKIFSKRSLSFYCKGYHAAPEFDWAYPCFVLVKNNSIMDSDYTTSFELFYYKTSNNRNLIDNIKILEKDKLETQLPEEFTKLPRRFISLGQSLNFYKTLKSLFPKEYLTILGQLNDCATNSKLISTLNNNKGFLISLTRNSEAQKAFAEASLLLKEEYEDSIYKFSFSHVVPGAEMAHSIEFTFNEKDGLPNRFNCIIGRNGTGKTQLLSQLAQKMCNIEELGEFLPDRPNFSKIIVNSFSYFDRFKLPARAQLNYEFIGIRDEFGSIAEKKITQSIWTSFIQIVKDREKKAFWVECIKKCLEADFLDFEIDDLENLPSKESFKEKLEDIFSSGQKIVFHSITRLISIIETNSLVIFDEPETHLHPSALAQLVKVLHSILVKYKSFGIIATHSAIILQDIPAKYVSIFDREGNFPIIKKLTIESFGENISALNSSVFETSGIKELYKELLSAFAKNMSEDEILKLFPLSLSFNAQLYLSSIIKK